MKCLKFVVAAAALLALPAPAVAQYDLDSHSFVDAVQKRDGDKATELIQAHPTIINSKDDKGNTALIIAINRNDPDWVGFMLNNNADPNAPGARGDTPLIAAARIGFEDAVRWLLGLGAKVDDANRMGETPLIIAVQQRQPRIVKLLLDAGADPDKTDSAAGYSARDYAKRDNRAREIQQMIETKKPKASGASTAIR